MKRGIIRFVLLFLSSTLSATSWDLKGEENSLQDRIPRDLIERNEKFLTITSENDLYGSGKDENYTNGFLVTYSDNRTSLPGLEGLLLETFPWFEVNETTRVYYSFGQNMYTPENILDKTPDPKDRPYAAFLYGAVGFSTLSENHVDDVELTLGVVGPSALGEPVQKAVHAFIDSDKPSGWDSQLKDEPAIMMAFQRQWPEAYAADLNSSHFRMAPHAGASVGNVYTYVAGGVNVQLTPREYIWQSTPLRVRPAIPGSGYFAVPENRFAWSVFAGLEGRVIGHNIFLDGNSYQSGPSVDKKYFVVDANGGLTFTYGKTQLSYTMNWRSKEFDGQSSSSVFGAVSLARRF